MLVPTKHENLSLNILVLGADLLKEMKLKPHNVDSLFSEIRRQKTVSLETYYDALTFLWVINLIEVDERSQIRRRQ